MQWVVVYVLLLVAVSLAVASEECGEYTPWGRIGNTDDSSCRPDPSSEVCSGQGTCSCGECRCNERFYSEEWVSGRYCECTNFLCPRYNGLLCSQHGECICNECMCEPGWRGEACSCQDSVDNCVNPGTGDVCSNHGSCECNQCQCEQSSEGLYWGKWCEDCPTCEGKCTPYRDCVQCLAFNTGHWKDNEHECAENCNLFNFTKVSDAEAQTRYERLCTFFDENDCRITFVYGEDEDYKAYVRIKKTLECPPSENDFFGSVMSVIGSMWQFAAANIGGLF